MKKIIFAFIIVFTSCIAKDEPFSPSLAKALDEVISEDSTYSVIQIQASKLEGHDLFFLTSLHNYNPNLLDGYLTFKGKLVTYFQTDSLDRSNIIDIKLLHKYNGNIPNFRNIYSSQITSEPKQKMYEVIDGHELVAINNPETLVIRKNKIKGDNVIINKQLNDIINDYIYNNIDVLYELRFKTENGKHYAILRSMIYYDKDKYEGYFYRDGHLVVIYGNPPEKIVDKTWIPKDKQGIPNFKHATIDNWNYPYPVKVEIFPNGTIRELSLSEGFGI